MIIIRTAMEDDMLRIMEIEREAFFPPWTSGGILGELLADDSYFALAVEDEAVLGFAILHFSSGDAELLQLAVDAAHRRRGVATNLMEAALGQAQERKTRTIYLEVRESNEAARSLYEKYGFKEIGRRKDYYINPIEDATTMARSGDII